MESKLYNPAIISFPPQCMGFHKIVNEEMPQVMSKGPNAMAKGQKTFPAGHRGTKYEIPAQDKINHISHANQEHPQSFGKYAASSKAFGKVHTRTEHHV